MFKDRVDKLLKAEQSLQPLVWAAANGEEICVHKLLDAGAWFNDSTTKDDSTKWYTTCFGQRDDPMTIAAKYGHVDVVRIFLDQGRDPTLAINNK